MRIERKYNREYVIFDEVKNGTFFEWENEVFFKIGYGKLNAYNCSRDTFDIFGFETKVIPLKAKVVIE